MTLPEQIEAGNQVTGDMMHSDTASATFQNTSNKSATIMLLAILAVGAIFVGYFHLNKKNTHIKDVIPNTADEVTPDADKESQIQKAALEQWTSVVEQPKFNIDDRLKAFREKIDRNKKIQQRLKEWELQYDSLKPVNLIGAQGGPDDPSAQPDRTIRIEKADCSIHKALHITYYTNTLPTKARKLKKTLYYIPMRMPLHAKSIQQLEENVAQSILNEMSEIPQTQYIAFKFDTSELSATEKLCLEVRRLLTYVEYGIQIYCPK